MSNIILKILNIYENQELDFSSSNKLSENIFKNIIFILKEIEKKLNYIPDAKCYLTDNNGIRIEWDNIERTIVLEFTTKERYIYYMYNFEVSKSKVLGVKNIVFFSIDEQKKIINTLLKLFKKMKFLKNDNNIQKLCKKF